MSVSIHSLGKRRLLRELRALRAAFPSARMLSPSHGAPIFEATVPVNGADRHVRLTLPPGYPSVPPELRELDEPGGRGVVPADGMHRFSDGSICLFAHGNDSHAWTTDRLAVEALTRFVELVQRERNAGERAHLFLSSHRIHVPRGIAETMQAPGKHGYLRIRTDRASGRSGYADRIHTEGCTELSFETDLSDGWKGLLPVERRVFWANVDLVDQAWEDIGADRCSLDAFLESAGPTDLREASRAGEDIILARRNTQDFDARSFQRALFDLQSLLWRKIEVGTPEDGLFHRNRGVIAEREQLKSTRVVLVGLGSLGAAIARVLAQAGIGRFVLLDPDYVTLENICRYIAPLNSVGHPKVTVVKNMIHGINPNAEIHTITKHLAWDLPGFGAGLELELLLEASDFIVSTCAEENPERQLNAFAVRTSVPVIYGTALGAAEHARIFRVLPGETACYECVLLAQEREPSEFPRFISSRRGEERPYLDPGLPGLAIDVLQIAMLTARLTLQTIARLSSPDIGIRDEVGHHLVWSNRGGWWLCDRALQVAIKDVPRASDCPVCGGNNTVAELDQAEAEELGELLAKLGAR